MSHQPNQEPAPMKRAAETAFAYQSAGERTDLLGSYTGIVQSEILDNVTGAVLPPRNQTPPEQRLPGASRPPVENGKAYQRTMQSPSPDMPVQDADDL